MTIPSYLTRLEAAIEDAHTEYVTGVDEIAQPRRALAGAARR